MKVLDVLHKKGKLDYVHFLVGSIMSNDSKVGQKYGYFDSLQTVCDANSWAVTVYTNHSKVLLFDTELWKFVIEKYSNLNENPKIEQFSFEKNEELYDMYHDIFDEVRHMR